MTNYKPTPPRCWEYELPGGFKVYAGKSQDDNDKLSLRFAQPNDYWFHVKGMSGSHVILRVEGIEPDRDTLHQAAAVAAYHSKARAAGTTPVTMTLAKNVSKPKGAKPGTVQVKRESTLKVNPGVPDSNA